MGDKKMSCPSCGNTDINEMLITWTKELPNGEMCLDTTTLPKFLYYLEHPAQPGQRNELGKMLRIEGVSCYNCHVTEEEVLKSSLPGQRVPTTRYGI